MLSDDEFDEICDEFQEHIEQVDDDVFHPDAHSVLSIGNRHYVAAIFCDMEEGQHFKDPLLQLFRSRRDLVRGVICADGFNASLAGAYDLGMWLQARGYDLNFGAKTRWGKIRIRLYTWVTRTVLFFQGV